MSGGTFTDFTLLDEANGAVHFFKVSSTPGDPSEAIEEGLRLALAGHGMEPSAVAYLAHGTTVATNIVIERRGARTGLLTTKGFRDVLELGRQARPSIYDYRVEKPPPLVPRDLRLEVAERIGPDGEMLRRTRRGVAAGGRRGARGRARSRASRSASCTATAVPSTSSARQARSSELLPDAYVSVSSEILPEFREFERMSTTVVNAFVGPRMGRYLERFRGRVSRCRHSGRALHDPFERRPDVRRDGARQPGAHLRVRPGRGRRRRGGDRPGRRASRTSSPSTSAAPPPTCR